jgi:hypothetical protein
MKLVEDIFLVDVVAVRNYTVSDSTDSSDKCKLSMLLSTVLNSF